MSKENEDCKGCYLGPTVCYVRIHIKYKENGCPCIKCLVKSMCNLKSRSDCEYLENFVYTK
ncbi:MAG: hypothetical protein ACFFG0_03910 [Candidatus Thorarchaeota archaeon]